MNDEQKEIMQTILGFEKEFSDYVLDPLHGQIGLTKFEKEITNTQVFKRLKNIQQLGFTTHIYPGATHKRYEHCIGTLFVTWNMFKRFLMNYSNQKLWNKNEVLTFFSNDILSVIRLSGLLHDIGHGPYSHSFENAVNDYGLEINHDDLSFYLLSENIPKIVLLEVFSREYLKLLSTIDILNEYKKELSCIPLYIREMILSIFDKRYKYYSYDNYKFRVVRDFLHDLIKGDVGSDRIDYLLRDTYFTGLGHRFNYTDLLENLSGIYNKVNNKLIFSIDIKGRNIIEFILMTRYYHYRLIAHNIFNFIEDIKFRYVFNKYIEHNHIEDKDIYSMCMHDDYIMEKLPAFNSILKLVVTKNLGFIGFDPYRFCFYRIAKDNILKKIYVNFIIENIMVAVPDINKKDIIVDFIIEKPHIPALHINMDKYKIEKKDDVEKYSVLLHDHSPLIKSLAKTYIEDSSIIVLSKKDNIKNILEYVTNTQHYYLDFKIFIKCLNEISDINRLDFILFCMDIITRRYNPIVGIGKLFDGIKVLQKFFGFTLYDYKKEYYDPSMENVFYYPKAKNKNDLLLDDLYVLEACNLIKIDQHLLTKGKLKTFSYYIEPVKRGTETGLKRDLYPIQKVISYYPQRIRDFFNADYLLLTNLLMPIFSNRAY